MNINEASEYTKLSKKTLRLQSIFTGAYRKDHEDKALKSSWNIGIRYTAVEQQYDRA